jgi:hypothetical protein
MMCLGGESESKIREEWIMLMGRQVGVLHLRGTIRLVGQ